jgi:hypothetical protein
MALNVGLNASFYNMNWKGIREKAGVVKSTKAYVTNYENSLWIVNGRWITSPQQRLNNTIYIVPVHPTPKLIWFYCFDLIEII